MKKILITFCAFTLLLSACSKKQLDLENPNEPNFTALDTEQGIARAGLGIYGKFGLEYWWYTLQNHDVMGDTYNTHVGNFSWRWLNQPTSMTLSDATVVTPPQGLDQPTEMRNRNTRALGADNQFFNEWYAMYAVNNQANLLLQSVDNPNLQLTGNAADKKNIIRAWAYWWKGFAYSRIGSIYVAGIIKSDFTILPTTNDSFVTHDQIITEANSNFDKAAAILAGLTATAEYNTLMGLMIPSFVKVGKGGVLTPTEWVRNINTYKARNILVNKPASALTAADVSQVLALATNGITASDKIFTMRSAQANDLVSQTAWQPYRTLAGWSQISERLIQEFYLNDARFTRNFFIPTTGFFLVNPQGRGFQYGTRYNMRTIEQGGNYSSITAGSAEIPVACSYEENELMLAEAKLRAAGATADAGLVHVDAVRTAQTAGLPATVGTSLTVTQALEVLRRERRIGLLNKNVSFYDARRQGYLKPVSQGGGRTGATLLYQRGTNPAALETGVTINYNYLEWWDVPQNELDFNKPRAGSAPVKAN